MKTTAILVLALGCMSSPVAAQDPPVNGQTEWRQAVRPLWQVDFGYPIRVSTGVTFVVGTERRLSGYETHLRGLVAGADAGLAGLSAKLGWADLRPYDAGLSGYSVEIVLVRPLGVDSRFDRDVTYLGPGGSYYFFCFRFSGGLLLATRTARRAVVPVATAAFVVPLRF